MSASNLLKELTLFLILSICCFNSSSERKSIHIPYWHTKVCSRVILVKRNCIFKIAVDQKHRQPDFITGGGSSYYLTFCTACDENTALKMNSVACV